MRRVLLLIAAVLSGLSHPLFAQDTAEPDPSISERLPLFSANRCATIRDQAEQLFCGDAELNAVVGRSNDAVQLRLGRLGDRSLAVEENVAWIRERNSSCGILAKTRSGSRTSMP